MAPIGIDLSWLLIAASTTKVLYVVHFAVESME